MATSRRAFVAACSKYVPVLASMRLDDVIGTSGVRAQAVGRDGTLIDDFVISETPGASHVRNAPSPAATSSLALARELVDRMELQSAAALTRSRRAEHRVDSGSRQSAGRERG